MACSLVSFRVAPVLVVTHVTSAHDHAKEQPYILPHQATSKRINHPSINNAYISQYSDTRVRWLKHVYRHYSIARLLKPYIGKPSSQYIRERSTTLQDMEYHTSVYLCLLSTVNLYYSMVTLIMGLEKTMIDYRKMLGKESGTKHLHKQASYLWPSDNFYCNNDGTT
jgi:hypothetical protein